jgi:predicted secreted protein
MNWMQPSVALAAMGRRAAEAAAALLVLTVPAMAGDRALIDYVGFSEDFRYFAFEEFGIQDGSGFAYSNIFVVDLDTDSWVIGTPVRVQAESEETSLVKVRSQAAQLAADHVDEFKLAVPVEIAAMIGDGVPDADATTLAFGAPGYMPGAVSGDYRLELTTYETTAVSPCEDWFGAKPMGYALTITDQGGERLIHRDAGLPRSRGCPLDYRLHSVLMPFEGATLSNAVAIISVYPGGFEGPDRRFLAVPLGL